VSEYDEYLEENPDIAAQIDAGMEVEEEIPPAPGEKGDLAVAPLAVREAAKLAAMTPEQKARYDTATTEIMAHPAVAAFAAEEERGKAAKEETRKAFLAAYKKKQKEKA
jgi:hypothetical protein